MNKSTAKSSKKCDICGQESLVHYLPKEIDRELFHEEIVIPAEPEPEIRRVAILRVTYQRDHFCSSCGHQGSQTYRVESQKHV
jgi:hypothetical protein